MAELFTIPAMIGLASAGVSAAGTIAAGSAQKASAEFQAKQLEQAAAEEKAAASREAIRARKEKEFVLSRQQSVASASNLGALDETILDLAGDVEQQGTLNEKMILYGGEERAKGRRAQAAAARIEGRAARSASLYSAAGTIMGGMGSFASDYGNKPFAPASSSYRYG